MQAKRPHHNWITAEFAEKVLRLLAALAIALKALIQLIDQLSKYASPQVHLDIVVHDHDDGHHRRRKHRVRQWWGHQQQEQLDGPKDSLHQ